MHRRKSRDITEGVSSTSNISASETKPNSTSGLKRSSKEAALSWVALLFILINSSWIVHHFQYDRLPRPLTAAQAGKRGFSEQSAVQHVKALTKLGPHPVGSDALSRAVQMLSREGAGDCSSCVAVMLELARGISHWAHGFKHAVIFLFNTGEEEGLNGAHSFITQHPWNSTIRTVVDLEAMGIGGKSSVFQVVHVVETTREGGKHSQPESYISLSSVTPGKLIQEAKQLQDGNFICGKGKPLDFVTYYVNYGCVSSVGTGDGWSEKDLPVIQVDSDETTKGKRETVLSVDTKISSRWFLAINVIQIKGFKLEMTTSKEG